MRILIKQFLGKLHSWSVFGWGIAESLIKAKHEVHLFSTDGIKHLPINLKSNLIGYTEENAPKIFGKSPDKNYDCQISYTALKNIPHYLCNGSKNRFNCWAFEWAGKNVLPTGFAKNYKYCDKLLVPSQFVKSIYMDSGIPESVIEIVPHGVSENYINNTSTIKLPTTKKFKLLANIAQNHKRKNIPGLLEAYGKAFNKNDDVCLIIKGKEKPITQQFEISLNSYLSDFNRKFPNHAEIKVYSEFLPDISSLYRSIDATFSLPYCEGFYFPGLESIISGKLAIAPNWGGQIDFLNSSNSLLIDGTEERADPTSMYWENKINAIWFKPSIEDAVNKLQYAYHHFQSLNSKIELQRIGLYNRYSWDAVTQQIMGLCK